jgi:hypothetical protein
MSAAALSPSALARACGIAPRRKGGGALAALVVSLLSPDARADPPLAPIPVRLEYLPHPGCPSELEFVERIRERTPRITVTVQQSAHVLRVELREAQGQSVGRLTLSEDGRTTDARTVSGTQCKAVAKALALTAVLSLDPDALLDEPPDLLRDEPPSKPALAGAVPADTPVAESTVPPRSPRDTEHTWSLGAGSVFGNPLTPGVMWGPAGFVENEWSSARRLVLALRISGLYAQGGGSVDTARAHFTWAAVGADACALQLQIAGLSVRPCILLLGGFLRGEGRGVDDPESITRSWWSGGPIARVRQLLMRHLALELWAGASIPFVRRGFIIDRQAVAEAPAVSWLGGLAVTGQGI